MTEKFPKKSAVFLFLFWFFQLKFRVRNFDMFVDCLHRFNYSSVCLSILTSCAKVPGLCPAWDGRVVRWCWVNFQCRGVLLIWMKVGQGPIVLAVGAGGGCLDFLFSRLSLPFLSLSLSGRRPDKD